ncbi:MAG: TolC family protein [Planctomycetes bacterium]|nr:TolC family protein [Planctomycetota bacterium]
MSPFHTIRGCALLTVPCLLVGCAKVHPEPDYQRTAAALKERNNLDEAYDPAADAFVDDKVTALLSDGLTVDDAVRIALLRNRGFQALFARIGASSADVVQSGLLSNPTFGFMARFPEGGGRSNLTFNFGQELVDLWQIPVRKAVARAQLEQTVMEVVQSGVNLAASTRQACYRLLALQRAEEITRENMTLVDRSLKLAEDRFKAGETSQLDVNLVRASLIEVRINRITIQRDLQTEKAALAKEMGLSRLNAAWNLSGSLDLPRHVVADDDSYLQFALDERLDARAAEFAVRQADAEVRRQLLNVFSSVTVGAELERTERRALPGRQVLADTARASTRAGTLTAPEIQTKGQRDLERRQIIDSLFGPTLTVKVPIWDQNQAQIAKAQYQLVEKKKSYEELLDTIARQVQEATAVLRAAGELVQYYEETTIPQARQNVEVAMRAYKAGEQSIVALIDAQRFMISQRLADNNVRRDYAIAMTELQRIEGGRLPVVMTPTTQPVATPQAGQ